MAKLEGRWAPRWGWVTPCVGSTSLACSIFSSYASHISWTCGTGYWIKYVHDMLIFLLFQGYWQCFEYVKLWHFHYQQATASRIALAWFCLAPDNGGLPIGCLVNLTTVGHVLFLDLMLTFLVFLYQHIVVVEEAIPSLFASLIRYHTIKVEVIVRRVFGGMVPQNQSRSDGSGVATMLLCPKSTRVQTRILLQIRVNYSDFQTHTYYFQPWGL